MGKYCCYTVIICSQHTEVDTEATPETLHLIAKFLELLQYRPQYAGYRVMCMTEVYIEKAWDSFPVFTTCRLPLEPQNLNLPICRFGPFNCTLMSYHQLCGMSHYCVNLVHVHNNDFNLFKTKPGLYASSGLMVCYF